MNFWLQFFIVWLLFIIAVFLALLLLSFYIKAFGLWLKEQIREIFSPHDILDRIEEIIRDILSNEKIIELIKALLEKLKYL